MSLLVICDSLIRFIITLVKGALDFKCDKRNTQIDFGLFHTHLRTFLMYHHYSLWGRDKTFKSTFLILQQWRYIIRSTDSEILTILICSKYYVLEMEWKQYVFKIYLRSMIITIRSKSKIKKISPWAIADVSGNNKLAIALIPSNKCILYVYVWQGINEFTNLLTYFFY